MLNRLIVGEEESIEELLPEIVEFALTPYLGAEDAQAVAMGKGRESEADAD